MMGALANNAWLILYCIFLHSINIPAWHAYFWTYSDKHPTCITSICKTYNCIKEPTLNKTVIKSKAPRKIFSRDGQNHITSCKTTYDIRAKGSVDRKHSKCLILLFWCWLLIAHYLLIVQHLQNQPCKNVRFTFMRMERYNFHSLERSGNPMQAPHTHFTAHSPSHSQSPYLILVSPLVTLTLISSSSHLT